MGNRLSKIYTRTGDDGSTGLGDGTRTPKDSLRVEAYGTVDELNSAIGVLAAANIAPELHDLLAGIQQRLFDLGGELCIPGTHTINANDVAALETVLDSYNADLPPLQDFVLPGGSSAGASCHLARTVCRRAERRICALAAMETVNPQTLHYVNRLSDLLFVIARVINVSDGHKEVLWQSSRSKGA